MQRLPVHGPSSTLPWSSTTVGSTPKKGSVAEPGVLAGSDLPENPPHDLPAARLRQAGRDVDHVGRGERADRVAHLLLEGALDALGVVARVVGTEDHVGVDPLPLDRVREAHHRRLGHRVVGHEGALDLGRAQPVAGDVQHVVDPAGDPVVAVLVAAAAVAGEVLALVGRKIRLHETLVVTVDGAHLARP